jgi:hypothetical protein
MEPEGSLPHSQVPANCLYPEPAALVSHTQQSKAKIHVWETITKDVKTNLRYYDFPTVEEQRLIFGYRNR